MHYPTIIWGMMPTEMIMMPTEIINDIVDDLLCLADRNLPTESQYDTQPLCLEAVSLTNSAKLPLIT